MFLIFSKADFRFFRTGRFLGGVLLYCFIQALSYAESIDGSSLKATAPNRYVIQSDDTLWGIAHRYVEQVWLWPFLWSKTHNNESPKALHVGDVLRLSWQQGKPTLEHKPHVALRPKPQHLFERDITSNRAIPMMSSSFLSPALLRYHLVGDAKLQASLSLLPHRHRHTLQAENMVYVKGAKGHLYWGIYRQVSGTQQPDLNVLQRVASLKLQHEGSEVSQLMVMGQTQEIRSSDRVLPLLSSSILSLTPQTLFLPAPSGVKARLTQNMTGSYFSADHQVLMLDKGQRNGVLPGMMLDIQFTSFSLPAAFDSSMLASSLPSKRIGTLLVIDSSKHTSLGLVMSTHMPLSEQVFFSSPLDQKAGAYVE